MANPVKTGDAKLWVYRGHPPEVTHQGCQAAEGILRKKHFSRGLESSPGHLFCRK